jgi:hypothetical protein
MNIGDNGAMALYPAISLFALALFQRSGGTVLCRVLCGSELIYPINLIPSISFHGILANMH